MKRLLIERKPDGTKETESFLTLPGLCVLAGIERPWIDAPTPGGKPFASCVPAGVYDIRPHTRGSGAEVIALINPDLGVHYLDSDRPPEGGRFLILMHVANWASDVVGCIGPGKYHADSSKGRMVASSKSSMKTVMDYIDGDDAQIEIRWLS